MLSDILAGLIQPDFLMLHLHRQLPTHKLSQANDAAVFLTYGYRGRTRPVVIHMVWPARVLVRVFRVSLVCGRLPRVLNIDEQGGAVRREAQTRDFAHVRSGQKTLDLGGFRVAHQHLVIAYAFELALVKLTGMHIGFYPQQAARSHRQTVGAAEKIT